MAQLERSVDLTSLRCLINSISRFLHLVTCQISKATPAEEDYKKVASFLKHLKPLLDDVVDHKAQLDEILCKECEELDLAVNEAREFLEKWSHRMSKILFVLQSKPLVLKIQICSVKISCILRKLFEISPATSSLLNSQLFVQESQSLKVGKLSEKIEDVLRSQKELKVPGTKHLMAITESLGLRSNQALLNEYIALEKERHKAQDNRVEGDLDQFSQIMDLISHIRESVVKLESVNALNGIQVPSYFRCPLSLEVMLDPVIVASGQTYERAAIQKWLDNGLVTCPKTGDKLSHQNLTPNYTVKALIENWCKENKVDLFGDSENRYAGSLQLCSLNISHESEIPCPSERKDSTSQSSVDIGHGLVTKTFDVSPGPKEEGSCNLGDNTDKFDQLSPEHSYVHSRSESASSAVSSFDYLPTASTEISRISSKQDDASDRSGEVTSTYPTSVASNKISGTASLSGKPNNSSNTLIVTVTNGNYNSPRTFSPSSDSSFNDLTTTSHVEELIHDLKSASTELQTAAAGELRFLAKHNTENRFIIGQCGAIVPLISLLHSDVELTKEHAVTALLNLSINEKIKVRIAEEGAIEPLINVLRTGNAGAKENAAAALFSISLLDEYRIKIGRSGAVQALVDLLGSGTVRGKKDAATALFNLSIFHENKARIVQAGAVKYLVGLMEPTSVMVDKAVAILANLSTIVEGCSAIAREGGIPLLVEIVEMGSERGKENAASILLQMCINSTKYCKSVLQEGAVPPLVALSQSGTPRAKEKAQQLLSHFRNQRENAVSRGRS